MKFSLRKKKAAEWGTVYDSVTKQPLDPVYVTVYDMVGREVATSITDLDGRYGFVLAPGMYRIVVGKTHYEFPSKRLAGKTKDEVYRDLYFGENIVITEAEQVISQNIPMDPLAVDWNETEKQRRNLGYFRGGGFEWLVTGLFALGFLIALIVFVLAPNRLHLMVFGAYVLLYFIKVLTSGEKKRSSLVIHSATREPVPFALVHVYAANDKREVTKKVTSYTGTFFSLIPNGNYFVTIETRNPDGTYTLAYTSSVFTVVRGMISKTFAI
ncbi:MAG TPA: carboxypeptidase-like regulatory domain-containing protein [Candidatus Paceibacterota bacterium]|nr:carboxypeptidase-like regulatory domain-containing protein [Candidatus Paceibacterota bacterium]